MNEININNNIQMIFLKKIYQECYIINISRK